MYIVYKITNVLNGKIYIGITTRTLEERWQQHCYDALKKQDNNYFHRAIRKYGKEYFVPEEIDYANTKEELKQKEIYYIEVYHTCIYDKNCQGYNSTYGGDLATSPKGEKNPLSKFTDSQRWTAIELLASTNLSYSEICLYTGIEGEKNIEMLNNGKTFHQEELNYPIRKNAKSISKMNEKNPNADEDKAKLIIYYLINTCWSQSTIAEIVGTSLNTVNDINRCVRWKNLHQFKQNIRKECGLPELIQNNYIEEQKEQKEKIT